MTELARRRRDRGGGRRSSPPRRRAGASPCARSPWSSNCVEAAADEAPPAGLRRAHRPQRGPAGRGGPGHGLHVLRVQGPSPGRGAVATPAGAARPDATVEPARRQPGRDRLGVDRVIAELRVLGLFMADDPTLAAACTTALLGSGPEVRALRVLFGTALHDRLASALGRRTPTRRCCAASTSPTAGPCCGRAWATSASRTCPTPWPTRPGCSSEARHDRRRARHRAETGTARRSTTAPTTTRSTRTPTRPTPGCGPRPRCTATTSSTSGPCRATPTCWPPSAIPPTCPTATA